MTTTTKTPKARPASKATTARQLSKAAERLAYQLGTTPKMVMAHALRIGLRNIDWNLSEDCAAFSDGTDTEDFNITAAMNRLSPARFAELCDGPENPQKVLVDEHSDARFAAMHAERKGWGEIVPFYAPPR